MIQKKHHSPNSFSRDERLSGVTSIDDLYARGSSFLVYPLRCTYFKGDCDPESSGLNRVLVSVPKRHHRRAVARNVLKRRIRESYRLNRGVLCGCEGLIFSLQYISKEVLESKVIENAIQKILAELAHRTTSPVG